MEEVLHLHKVVIPVDGSENEPQGFIFESSDATQCQTLMVILNGAGVVRAGQWSRKLIINDSIEVGSQFPYILRARAAGYGVMVLNTNQNSQVINGKAEEIRGSEKAENHGLYVWKHIISKTKATNIVIVAHSYGGIVTCTMAEQFLDDFKKRVFCVVFTDTVHTMVRQQWSQPVKEFLKERAVNFASAYVPINYMMETSCPDDCLSVSAGTEEHERTSSSCIDIAFQFIHENLASWMKDGSMAPHDFLPLPDDLSQFSVARRWTQRKEKAEEGAGRDTSPTETKKRPSDSEDQDSPTKKERKREGGSSELRSTEEVKGHGRQQRVGRKKGEGEKEVGSTKTGDRNDRETENVEGKSEAVKKSDEGEM
ncbi:cotranscriptional regulator ARB2A homolog isoform X2 [Babylonia areolata]